MCIRDSPYSWGLVLPISLIRDLDAIEDMSNLSATWVAALGAIYKAEADMATIVANTLLTLSLIREKKPPELPTGHLEWGRDYLCEHPEFGVGVEAYSTAEVVNGEDGSEYRIVVTYTSIGDGTGPLPPTTVQAETEGGLVLIQYTEKTMTGKACPPDYLASPCIPIYRYRGVPPGGAISVIVFGRTKTGLYGLEDIPIQLFSPTCPSESSDKLIAWLSSPGELRVYDLQGNVTGIVEGVIEQEIPWSTVFEDNLVVILQQTGKGYKYTVIGKEEGSYGLTTVAISDGKSVRFDSHDVPLLPNATHQYTIDWDALERGKQGVTLQIDNNGDGIFEKTIYSGAELDGRALLPTSAITFPENGKAIRGTIAIIGTASGEGFEHYIVEYSPGSDPGSWALLYRSNDPVIKEALATWDTTSVLDGEYIIRLTVADTSGFTSETRVKVLVDNTPPAIQNLLPVGEDFVPTKPTISATLTDNLSGIDETTVLLKINDKKVDPAPSFDPETGRMTWTAQDPLPDGRYEVTLDVKDKAGNAAEQARTSFAVFSELEIADVLNYPNPCSSGTTFTYNLSQEAHVRIEIYTLAGELIKVMDPVPSEVGYNEQYWDGTDDQGYMLDNGVYIYRIVAEANGKMVQAVGKLVILR